MFWIYFILSIVLLIAILTPLYFFNTKIKIYINKHYPELIVNTIIIVWSVFLAAYLALEFTKQINNEDDEKSYLSMIIACKNMNERYIKNFKNISSRLDSDSLSQTEINRLINNVMEPFLLEEILKNSNLFKCASLDFRNWLPDMVSFMKGNNWMIIGNDNEIFEYNYHFLHFLKEILSNEESYIKNSLSEKEITTLNDKTRLKFQLSIKDIPLNDLLLEIQSRELTDSVNAY